MEEAVEALKTVFAVTIFALALTVFFRMTTMARDTADQIFAAIDKTTYVNYNSYDTQDGANRIVTFQEIIPTIYRYAQEGYGVTIIDGGEIKARFDLDTESQVSNCLWNTTLNDKVSRDQIDKSNQIKGEIRDYLNKRILTKYRNNINR